MKQNGIFWRWWVGSMLVVGLALGGLWLPLRQFAGLPGHPEAERLQEMLPLALLGAGLLAAGLAMGMVRLLVGPLQRMVRVAQALSRGHYSARVQVSGQDELAQLGHAFNDLAARLDRQQHSRRQFLSNVAHELRTPLTYIHGYMEAVVDGTVTDPAQMAEHQRIVLEETGRLSRLIQSLLDLATLEERGSEGLSAQPVCLLDVAAQAVRTLNPAAQSRQVLLTVQTGLRNPTALANPDAVHQIMVNLIDNALEHTNPGDRITLGISEEPSGLVLSVCDTGRGVPTDVLPHLFERFYRADKARTDGGRGLGLAIVKALAEAQHGAVEADLGSEGGLCIRVMLPRAREERL